MKSRILAVMVCMMAVVNFASTVSASNNTQLFFDDFTGTALDTSIWSVFIDSNGEFNTPYVAGGLLYSQGYHTRIDSIGTFAAPETGQSVIARARIRLAGEVHKFGFAVNPQERTGPISGYYFDTYHLDTGLPEDHQGREHYVRALALFQPASGSMINLLNVEIPVTWYEFHEFAIERTPSEVIFSIDGQEVARVADAFGGALPVGVWNDRGSLMQTDWVDVYRSEPTGPPPEPWRFVQISDTHIGWKYAYRNLDATIREINELLPAPDFVLVTGDIAHYGCQYELFSLQCPDHYSEFETLMDEKLKIPYYVVPGNHDRRGPALSTIAGAVCTRGLRCYSDHFADRLSFQPTNRNFLFIGLDTGDGNDEGELSPDMVNFYKWKGTLYPTLPKIVFMHHPGVGQKSIQNPDEFLKWCDDNKVKLVLAGHTHEGHVLDRLGNEPPVDSVWPKYVQTPSCGVSGLFGTGDDEDLGYRVFDVTGDEVIVGSVEGIQDTLAEMTKFQGNSPINLHMYDSVGGHVGIGAGGEVEYGIPDSFYHRHYTVEIEGGTDVFPETIYIFGPTANYLYEVVGTESGTYGLDITSTSGGNGITFTATDIPTSSGAKHVYAVNWGTLSAGGEGVFLHIDENGDGSFEQMIIADDDLTSDEFALQTEAVIDFDPDTLNLNSQGKFATVYIELPADFDVSEIDLFSLELNELVTPLPRPITIGDYDNDGTNDLMVKFDRQELIATLGTGEEQMVNLTGRLWDGKPFAGSDFIRVIH